MDTAVAAACLDHGIAPNGGCRRAFGKGGVHGFDLTFCAQERLAGFGPCERMTLSPKRSPTRSPPRYRRRWSTSLRRGPGHRACFAVAAVSL